MKALAQFITQHSKVLLIVMVVLALASAFLLFGVEINADMTKYLADDSGMKIGMDIMEEELASTTLDSTIRVMFTGLPDAEKEGMADVLAAIPYVKSVSYDPDSADYNSGDYTKYVISTEYDYDTLEERSIEKALKKDFKEYDVVYHNDNASAVNLPFWVVALALSILMVILVIMSNSWVEPVLFVITIGAAVLLNMGTNIILGSVSNITFSIAAILQLVLSMDYSIILMNRYRQEYARVHEKKAAMATALQMAFSSVTSSGLTTIVGLLMLVFMSFKIGFDLGVVLAKGVFFSMICVFTVLPGLILLASDLIMKTGKPVPDVPLFHLAGGMYRLRYLFIPLLCILFFGAMYLQSLSEVSYTQGAEDLVAEVFPTDNSIVMLYNNVDEEKISDLVDYFDDDPYIKDASSYPTLLGKPYTASEMADNIGSMTEGTDMDISADLLSILYYDYFAGDDLPELSVSDFLLFLSDYVADNETFSDYLGDDIRDNLDMMVKFADAANLTSPMTASEMADFFGMDGTDLEDLYLYYFIENGGVETGTMTLSQFCYFVIHEVAEDPDYGDLFDEDTLEQMEVLETYTDAVAMTKSRSYTDMAQVLGMDAETVKLLYVYYYALLDSYDPGSMTVVQFVDFLLNDIANDETFSDYFDEDTLEQMSALQTYLDPEVIGTKMSAAELSDYFGMGSGDTLNLLLYYYILNGGVETGTMTLSTFADFVVNEVAADATYGSLFDADTLAQMEMLKTYTDASAMTTGLTYPAMASSLGMDAEEVRLLYAYYYALDEDYEPAAMTLSDFFTFLCGDVAQNETFAEQFDTESLAELEEILPYLDAELIQTQMSAAQLAELFGTDESVIELLMGFLPSSGEEEEEEESTTVIVLSDFMSFLYATASDDAYSGLIGDLSSLYPLLGALTGTDEMEAAELTELLSSYLGEETAQMLVSAYLASAGTDADDADGSDDESAPEVTLSPYEFVETILALAEDSRMVSMVIGEEMLAELSYLETLMDSVIAGTTYSPAEMAAFIRAAGMEMDEFSLKLLYAYRESESAGWTLTTQEIVNFLVDQSSLFGEMLGDYLSGLQTAAAIINGSVAGTAYSYRELASLMGMSSSQSRQLYLLYQSRHGDTSSWGLSPYDFVSFLVTDVASSSDYGDMIDADTLSQLTLVRDLMKAAIEGTAYSYSGMADLFGMDADTMKMLYTFYASSARAGSWSLSVQTVMNFLVDRIDTFGSLLGDSADDLVTAQKIINGSVAGTSYTYGALADLMGMEEDQSRQLFLLYESRHGDVTSWKMSVQQFVNFVLNNVLSDPDYADLIDSETSDLLDTAQVLVDAVIGGEEYTAADLSDLLSGISEELDENSMELLYLYYAGVHDSDPGWELSVHQMFDFLADELVEDSRFSLVLGEDFKEEITDMQQQLLDGIAQLKGENHAILAFTTSYPEESADTIAFLDDLIAYADEHLEGDYYLIGSSPMVYEMRQGFHSELVLITWLTAISIFIVVALTFRSLLIPLILVLVVQTGVYLTVATCGFMGYSIYNLALLIVQCILMGATIDYGILFTNYYRENRRHMDQASSLAAAYRGASHTIFTSGLIMIVVTAIIGVSPADPTIAQICLTIAIGVTCAVLVIVLVLPGVLAAFDRFVVKKPKTPEA